MQRKLGTTVLGWAPAWETTLFNARASLNLCWTVSCLFHIWGLCEGRRLSSLGPASSIVPDTDVQSSSLASSVYLILENLATQRKRGREASEQNVWFCLPIPGNWQTARRRVCQLWVVGHPLLVACPYKWIFVETQPWFHSFTCCYVCIPATVANLLGICDSDCKAYIFTICSSSEKLCQLLL